MVAHTLHFDNFTCHNSKIFRGRKRVYNEGRVSALRRWLLNVFGLEYLSSGSGILDVAGGKGEFSFEALNLNGIQSTVFDPRPLDLYRYKRKLQFGFYHRNEVLGGYNQVPPPEDGVDAKLPQHIRGFFEMFDPRVTGSIFSSSGDSVENEIKAAGEVCLPKLLRNSEGSNPHYLLPVAGELTTSNSPLLCGRLLGGALAGQSHELDHQRAHTRGGGGWGVRLRGGGGGERGPARGGRER